MKKKTTIVFSINVHENVKFLQKQIEDIEANVLLDFVVLINANEYMYNEIINNKPLMAITAKASKATKAAKAFIELYPEPINKIHNHGTLTKGIYLNMEYAVRNYDFEYFIVLSSRNLFYNTLHKDNYHAMPRISYGATIEQLNYQEWHWRIFLQTKLGQYIIANNWRFCQAYMHHEGLGFDYASSTQIVDFLEKNKNKDIKEDLFNFNWGVEEFALHSIALNLTGYYYNIGNWTNDDDFVNIHKLPSDRFVYKTFRR